VAELFLLPSGAKLLCDRTGWRGFILRVTNSNPANKGEGQGAAQIAAPINSTLKGFIYISCPSIRV